MSTVQIFNQGVNNLLDRQADVTKTQEQLASGKRIMTRVRIQAGAARTLDITSQLARIDAYQRNTGTVQSSLGLEEGALSGVINDLQRARELTIRAITRR
jgi:flagellar hook-associated protein 3 FlgL